MQIVYNVVNLSEDAMRNHAKKSNGLSAQCVRTGRTFDVLGWMTIVLITFLNFVSDVNIRPTKLITVCYVLLCCLLQILLNYAVHSSKVLAYINRFLTLC